MLFMKKLILLLYLIICSMYNVFAQNEGDYRAIASGNYEDPNIWQKYDSKTKSWIPAVVGSPDGSFTIGSSYTVNINSSALAGNMTLYGTINLPSGVTFTAVRSNLYTSCSVNGPGVISVGAGDTLEMYAGTIASNENMIIQNGGLLILDVNPMSIYGTITNYGTAICSSNENGSGTFINYGTFTTNNAGNFSPNFTNYNVLNFNGGIFNTFSNLNPGIVNVLSKTLLIRSYTSPVTESGVFNISSGAELFWSDGSVNGTYNFSGTIQGSGTMHFGCAAANISGTYNINGITKVTSGNTNFDSSANIISIGSVSTTGGTLNFLSGVTINGLGTSINIQYSTINFNTGSQYSFDTLIVYGGGIGGSDNVSVNKFFNDEGGAINGTGSFTLNTGCTMSTSVNPLSVNTAFINNGTINWTSENFQGAGTFTNNGTINVLSNFVYCTSNFINSSSGILNISGTANLNLSKMYSNSGTINLNGGALSLSPYSGKPVLGGTINTSAGTTLTFSGAFSINSNITSAGNININSNEDLHGVFNNLGTTTISSGNVNFNSDMTLTNIGNINSTGGAVYFKNGLVINAIGSTVNIGGTVDFSTGHTIALQNLTLTNTLSGSDSITISGNFVSDGFLEGPGKRTILASGTGTLWDNAWIYSSTILYNLGTLTWQDNSLKNYGTIDNRNIFNIISAGNSISYVTILNNGIINRTTNSSQIIFNYPLTNNGTLNIYSGSVAVYNNSTNAGTINISSGASMTLLSGPFTSSGTINDSANSNINGGYQLNFNGSQMYNDGSIAVTTLQFGGNTILKGSGNILASSIVINSGHVTLGSDQQIKNLAVNSGGIFDLASYKLLLNGSGTPISNNGTFTAVSGIVEYNGTSAQTIAVSNINYSSLSINNSSGVTLNSAISIPSTLYLKTGTFTVGSYLSMGNGSAIDRSGGNLSSAPNFGTTVNLVYDEKGSVITSGLEVPVSSSVLNNLTVNNSGGLILGSNTTANGIVTLQNGNIITGDSNSLNLASSSSLSGEINGRYIIGKLIITKNVGTSNSNFGGIGVRLSAGTDNLGNVTVTRISGSSGKITADSISSIDRTWIISSDNSPASGRTLILAWTSDDDNGKSLTNVQAWQSSNGGTSWNTIGTMQDASVNRAVSFLTNSFGEFTVSDPSVTVNLKVFLQGPYNGSGAMTSILNDNKLLPLTSETAYPSSTYGYTASTVAGIPNSNIVDWILVELRTGTAASSRVSTRAGFLKNDGSIVDVDGVSPLSFSGIFSGSYYIVIRHRNHLAIMSAAAISLSSSTPLYNFSSAQSQAYGTNPMASLTGGIFGMYAGDVNGDGVIKYNLGGNDRAVIYARIGGGSINSSKSGYFNEDVNLDGVVKYNLGNNDRAIIYQNIGGSSINLSISSQVPK